MMAIRTYRTTSLLGLTVNCSAVNGSHDIKRRTDHVLSQMSAIQHAAMIGVSSLADSAR